MHVAGDSELMRSTLGNVFVKAPGTGTVLCHAKQVSNDPEGPYIFTWQDGACVITVLLQYPSTSNYAPGSPSAFPSSSRAMLASGEGTVLEAMHLTAMWL